VTVEAVAHNACADGHHKVIAMSASPVLPVTPPLIVSTAEARRLLGNMCADRFWVEARNGAFGELLGSKRKRYVRYENLQRYIESLPSREPRPLKQSKNLSAA
jgi:hypothetical protein